MPHTLLSDKKVVMASVPHIGTAGTMTATAVDGTGFDRACFVIAIGAMENTATLNAQITDCDTTGGSYTNTAGTALTQIADTGGSKIHTIDVPVKAGRPFMKTLIVTGTAAAVNSAICILYRGSKLTGVATGATQAITI